MKSITFQIALKPISLNHSHEMKVIRGPRGRIARIMRGKTAKTKTFEILVRHQLGQIKSDLEQFSKGFDPTEGCIHMDAYFYINKDEFFTKPKSKKNPRVRVSRNSLDLSNCLKVVEDVIFNFIGIDDVSTCYINAQKIPTDGHPLMIFKLTKAPFPAISSFSADHLSHL